MRVDHYVLGYRKITLGDEDRAACVSALLKRGLSAKISNNGVFAVASYRTKKYKSALKRYDFSVSEIKGLPAFFLKYRYRYGIIVGIMLAFVYIFFSSSFVWDVRIEGNETISDAALREELAMSGFDVGTAWREKELSEIETDVLQRSDSIGWISIVRRGGVAIVTLREKNTFSESEENGGFSNIVASRDCVIEKITVRRGIAMVKAGDTVKAGELLISGVIPEELGGGFVRADGDVYALIHETSEVTVPKIERSPKYGEPEKREVSLKIFNFSLKLFKKYGKVANDCVIIEDEEDFVLFGKYRIPFGIRRVYASKRSFQTREYTEGQMVSVAAARLKNERARRFSSYDVVRMQTVGEFTADGYKLMTNATVLKSIGEERYFVRQE